MNSTIRDSPKNIKLISVYARVSTSAQEEQETIQAQLFQIREYAKEHGYFIVKEYLDDGWSGDSIARPSLDELRIDAKKKIWDAVLIYDPDRLARRYSYQELIMDELVESGKEVIFVTTAAPKDYQEKILHGVRGLFAQYERAKIAERFRIGKVNRIRNGNMFASEAPYGYTYIPNSGRKGTPDFKVGYYIVNEKEAEVIGQIFHWVGNEGLTLHEVVKRLDELGIKPRKSKRGVWTTGTLGTLLRNKTFIGKALWGTTYAVTPERPFNNEKYKRNKKTSKRMRPEKEWMSVNVPRIIDDLLFERVAQKLKKNFENRGRNKINEYLLSGKIWCTCGRRRAGEGPQKGKFLYYRCTDRVYTFPSPRTCFQRGLNARVADELVWQQLKSIMSDPVLMNEQIEKWNAGKTKKKVIEESNRYEVTKKEIQKLEEKEKRYTNAYSEGVIDMAKLKEFVMPLQSRIVELKKVVEEELKNKTETNITSSPTENDINSFVNEVKGALDTLNFEVKKAIISETIEKVTATQKDLQVYGYINLNQIYVESQISYRYCWASKRWEVYTF